MRATYYYRLCILFRCIKKSLNNFARGLLLLWLYLATGRWWESRSWGERTTASPFYRSRLLIVERLNQLHIVINTLSLPSPLIEQTWQHFGTLYCLSCLHVISADVLPCADLILGKGEWTGEIDGGVPSQTDNTWFCLQGVGLAHSSPLHLRCVGGCAEEVNRSFTQCKFGATFRGDPRTIEPTWPRALGTTWSMHQPHLGEIHTGMGGHLFNTGASCISMHSEHTRLKARPETQRMPDCTHNTQIRKC